MSATRSAASCRARLPRSTSSRRRRTPATPSPSCSTPTGSTTTRCSASRNWTNLSETTFVLPPTDAGADYRVRIFTPTRSCRSPGHPTLGTCHAWLEAGGRRRRRRSCRSARPGWCGSAARRTGWRSPRRRWCGPGRSRSALVEHCGGAGHRPRGDRRRRVGRQRPGLGRGAARDAEAVLALRPRFVDLDVGVVGPYPPGRRGVEVRAFFPKDGAMVEDPVTGSLNASLAQWLLGPGGSRRRTSPARAPRWGARAGARHAGRRRDLGRRRHGHVRLAARWSSETCIPPTSGCAGWPRRSRPHRARQPCPQWSARRNMTSGRDSDDRDDFCQCIDTCVARRRRAGVGRRRGRCRSGPARRAPRRGACPAGCPHRGRLRASTPARAWTARSGRSGRCPCWAERSSEPSTTRNASQPSCSSTRWARAGARAGRGGCRRPGGRQLPQGRVGVRVGDRAAARSRARRAGQRRTVRPPPCRRRAPRPRPGRSRARGRPGKAVEWLRSAGALDAQLLRHDRERLAHRIRAHERVVEIEDDVARRAHR